MLSVVFEGCGKQQVLGSIYHPPLLLLLHHCNHHRTFQSTNFTGDGTVPELCFLMLLLVSDTHLVYSTQLQVALFLLSETVPQTGDSCPLLFI